jgi:hypothetical protein
MHNTNAHITTHNPDGIAGVRSFTINPNTPEYHQDIPPSVRGATLPAQVLLDCVGNLHVPSKYDHQSLLLHQFISSSWHHLPPLMFLALRGMRML